jgi:succinoglycan biosynthesis protein ExoO
VSIAIACYNAGAWLDYAVRSALAQTERAIEVIVVDDCSTDGAVVIAQKLAAEDNRVRVEPMAKNGGPAVARNRALELARGEWFAILDADDFYAPDRLAALLDAACRHEADIVADNMVVFAQSGTPAPRFFLPAGKCGQMLDMPTYLDETAMFSGGANYGYLKPVIRTAALRRLSVAYDPTLRIGEDDDLIVRLLVEGARYWIANTTGYAYRKHDGSISHRLPVDAAGALEDIARRYEADPALAAMRGRLARRRRAFTRAHAFAVMVEALKQRDGPQAFRAAIAAPGAVALLRQPLLARAGRLRRRFADRPDVGDPDAMLLLRAWQQSLEAAS